ncbi:unnamed protein product [Penicillium nalgiovense]|uniref:Restriction of telomere capping protein 4 n=1 Tax=Penicillium nalgiovense TaxID=60175 RepID=A0A9W4MW28_PENNA|nr:unnamed protein product [Penicillium nalgiovense]CAG7963324.1 unnamed protein product [Penicillium nalgiovense]CAG7964577.1 unnamed protein product [Penicillium nalgiovense]CAG7965574.1 unnamed protein product [Penicillium nalgiovense]CAG7969824.1 unnamed protein product [Penicillium nalgiovense]
MATQAKPDPSYASNLLTRRNAPRGHLLSTFNRPESEDAKAEVAGINKEGVHPSVEAKLEINTDAEPLSSDDEEAEGPKPDIAQPTIEKRAEIDADAEPLSSDEEEVEDPMPDIAQPSIENKPESTTDTEPLSSPSLSSLSPIPDELEEVPKSSAPQSSIKAKLDIDTDADPLSSDEEQVSDSDASLPRKERNYTTMTLEKKLAEGNNGGYSSPQTHNSYSRKGTFSRTHSAMTGSDDEEDLFFFSSQSHKRQRATKYASKASYFNRPSFPPRPTEKAKEPSPVEETPKEPEETFIMPKDIENSSFREPRGGEDSNSSFSHGPYTMEEYEAMLLDDDSPLSSPSSSTYEQMSQSEELAAKENRQPSPPRRALCPMCHKEVDWASLEIFKAQPKQRIREQVMFCESHKLRSAMDLWRERGYPNIDWDGFEERVQSYFPQLEKLLVPGAFSYYRNILSTSFAPGKARNFRVRVSDGERLETMTCGYYGTMGATKILETIIRRFSVVVRRLATTDDLIKTAGVAGYTQSVLVPELAVLLVKDDMKVNDEDARRIMRESMDIGDRVNPDRNVVPIPEEVDL